MKKFTVFNYKPAKIFYGTNLGTAILNYTDGTIRFPEETIESIRQSSINGKCILDTMVYMNPSMDLNGLIIMDEKSADKFFVKLGNLSEVTKSEAGNRIIEFYRRGCLTCYENNRIELGSDALSFFEITPNTPCSNSDTGEYELLVGVIEKDYSNEEYKEYFLIFPSEETELFQTLNYMSITNDLNLLKMLNEDRENNAD